MDPARKWLIATTRLCAQGRLSAQETPAGRESSVPGQRRMHRGGGGRGSVEQSEPPLASVEHAPRVDDDRLPGHGLGAAHGDDHVGAVVLVGGLLQE